jgi:carbamoyl-phosphate synthase large subunit
MRSTGEVLGMADSFELAYFKAQEAAQALLPIEGTVLISVNDPDKPAALEVARAFYQIGFSIMATSGTQAFLAQNGIPATPIRKMHEGRPNIVDGITNKEIQLVINSAAGKRSQFDDSYIRKAAIRFRIPYITTMTAALASARGIAAFRNGGYPLDRLKSLQEYHAAIRDQ